MLDQHYFLTTTKKLIERAYLEGPKLGLAVWTEDEAGPLEDGACAGQ